MTPALASPYGAARIRTAALPAPGDMPTQAGVSDATHALLTRPALPGTLSAVAAIATAGRIVTCDSLLDRAYMDVLLWAVTSPPMVLAPLSSPVRAPAVAEAGEPMARHAVEGLKAAAQLTNEEVAGLAGVSRRSVQAWLAGGAITGPKEQHLRLVVEAVRDLEAESTVATRARLFGRKPGHVRPYDLLAEGHYEAAVASATGRVAARGRSAPSAPSSLAAQFNHHEDRIDVPERSLNRTLSGRLRR